MKLMKLLFNHAGFVAIDDGEWTALPNEVSVLRADPSRHGLDT